MERSSTNSFMKYCDSTRHSLFRFLEKTNDFSVNSDIFNMIRRQDDFLMRMIEAEHGSTSEMSPRPTNTTTNVSNQTAANPDYSTQIHPRGSSVSQREGGRSRGGSIDTSNQTQEPNLQHIGRNNQSAIPTGELFQVLNNSGANESFSSIIQTMATNTLLPALTNFLDRATASSNPARGLTQDEIDEATTEICYNEIEDPTNRICPISQEELDENEQVIMLQCGHIYKKDKILQWFTQGTYCPLCRIPLTTREHGSIEEPMTLYVGITLEDEHGF